jgi:hypothetical protein
VWASPLAVVAAVLIVLTPIAEPDRKPPRIVAAVMVDANGNARADRVRLTYSERVRHALDRDGRYPFTVAGYRIRSVGAASGRTLVLLLQEKQDPDAAARPSIRYRRTASQPVRDLAGKQAAAQLFRGVREHGHTGPPPPEPVKDSDSDGTPDAQDCAPANAAIHPGAPDSPELQFVDSNCDGIDGTEAHAIFVSPNGDDANPGTKAKPKRQIQAAVNAAAGKERYVLVAFGSYGHVKVTTGARIFGGYDPTTWARGDRYPDGLPVVTGSPEGVLADGAKDVVLQHLEIRGSSGGAADRSAYGIRAIDRSSLTLQRVVVRGGNGEAGAAGANGEAGARGSAGGAGEAGACTRLGPRSPAGGAGGRSPAGRTGGRGGGGRHSDDGEPGGTGLIGTPGGAGGESSNKGSPGGRGRAGENGAPGPGGFRGTNSTSGATATWAGRNGGLGFAGQPGNGGGGGGAGGANEGVFQSDGTGDAGGGGGGGGAGGKGGAGGAAGGGSFGIYLLDSMAVIEASTVAAARGGAGGNGGDGGFGGGGGAGGRGSKYQCSDGKPGTGGDGGTGGAGGRGGGGGGGAGGPSIAIFNAGTSTATVKSGSTVAFGAAGAGGAGGDGGPGGAGVAGATGIAKAIYP